MGSCVAIPPHTRARVEVHASSVGSSNGVRGMFAREWIPSGTAVFEAASNDMLNATTCAELSVLVFCHAAIGGASPSHNLISSTLGKLGESLFESLPASAELRGAPHMKLEQLRWARLRPSNQCRALFENEPNEEKRAAIMRAWSLSPHSNSSSSSGHISSGVISSGSSSVGGRSSSISGISTFGLWLWAVHQVRSRGFTGHARSGEAADATANGAADDIGNEHVVLPSRGALLGAL